MLEQTDGWLDIPGLDAEAKQFATEQVSRLFDKHPVITISMVDDAIFGAVERPPCFRNVALWDARDHISERAVRAAYGERVWRRSYFGNELRKLNLEAERGEVE